MRKFINIIIVSTVFLFLLDSLNKYFVYHNKGIQIKKTIENTTKEIQTLKHIEIKKFKPIGVPYTTFNNKNPIKKFENEEIYFSSNKVELKKIKDINKKIYKEIKIRYALETNFTTLINLLNYIENENLFHSIDKLEFKKNNENLLSCKLDFTSIVYFEKV